MNARWIIFTAFCLNLCVCAQQRGDFDSDGQAHVDDIVRLANHLSARIPLADALLPIADVDGNGTVDATDLTTLADAVAGLYDLLLYAPPTLTGPRIATTDSITLTGHTQNDATVIISNGTEEWDVLVDWLGNFSLTVPLTPGGRSVFSARAELDGHQTTSRFWTVEHDNSAPGIEIISPIPGDSTSEPLYVVSGYAWDAVSPIASVQVNGVPAILSPSPFGLTSWSVAMPVTEGIREFTATVTDAAGFTAQASSILQFEADTGFRIQSLTGELTGTSGVPLNDPLAVSLRTTEGLPVDVVVTYRLIRGAGHLSATPTIAPEAGQLAQVVATNGVAQAYLQPEGAPARSSHIVEAHSTSFGTVRFVIHTTPNQGPEILVRSGAQQRGPLGAPAAREIEAFVHRDGVPLVGVPVAFSARDGAWFATGETVEIASDSNGVARATALLGAQEGSVDVYAPHGHASPARVQLLGTLPGLGTTAATGLLRDHLGQPVAGVTCTLHQLDQPAQIATTNDAGVFSFPNGQRGRARLDISATPPQRIILELTAGIENQLGSFTVAAEQGTEVNASTTDLFSLPIGNGHVEFEPGSIAETATLVSQQIPLDRVPGMSQSYFQALRAFSILPAETTFLQPGQLRVAPTAELAIGSTMTLLRFSPEYQAWKPAGVLTVSASDRSLRGGDISRGGLYVLAQSRPTAEAVGCKTDCNALGGDVGELTPPDSTTRSIFEWNEVAEVAIPHYLDSGGFLGITCREDSPRPLPPVVPLQTVTVSGSGVDTVPLAVEHRPDLGLDIVRFGAHRSATYTLEVEHTALRPCGPTPVVSTKQVSLVNCQVHAFSCITPPEFQPTIAVANQQIVRLQDQATVGFTLNVPDLSLATVEATLPDNEIETFEYNVPPRSIHVAAKLYQQLGQTPDPANDPHIHSASGVLAGIEAIVTETGTYYATFTAAVADDCLAENCAAELSVISETATVIGDHMVVLDTLPGAEILQTGQTAQVQLTLNPPPADNAVVLLSLSSIAASLDGAQTTTLSGADFTDGQHTFDLTGTGVSTSVGDVLVRALVDGQLRAALALTVVDVSIAEGPYLFCTGSEQAEIPLTFEPKLPQLMATATLSGPNVSFGNAGASVTTTGSEVPDVIQLQIHGTSTELADHSIALHVNGVLCAEESFTMLNININPIENFYLSQSQSIFYTISPNLPGTIFSLSTQEQSPPVLFDDGSTEIIATDSAGPLQLDSHAGGEATLSASFDGHTCQSSLITVLPASVQMRADYNHDGIIDADDDLLASEPLTLPFNRLIELELTIEGAVEIDLEDLGDGNLQIAFDNQGLFGSSPLPLSWSGPDTISLFLHSQSQGSGELRAGNAFFEQRISYVAEVGPIDLQVDSDNSGTIDLWEQFTQEPHIVLVGDETPLHILIGTGDTATLSSEDLSAALTIRDDTGSTVTLPIQLPAGEYEWTIQLDAAGDFPLTLEDDNTDQSDPNPQSDTVILSGFDL